MILKKLENGKWQVTYKNKILVGELETLILRLRVLKEVRNVKN